MKWFGGVFLILLLGLHIKGLFATPTADIPLDSIISSNSNLPKITQFRGGAGVIRTSDVHHSHKKVEKGIKTVQKKLVTGKFRAVMSLICGFCILVEFFEDVLDEYEIPFFLKIKKHTHLGVGLLLLTLSHVLHSLVEILDTLEDQSAIIEEREKLKEALVFFQGSYASEEEAAKAYDAAALTLFGYNTFTNFVINQEDYMTKRSKFRGVIWNNIEQCWKVDTSLFLH